MKVIIHIELNDEQRNALSRQLKPRAEKRRATRDEVRDYVLTKCASLFTMDYSERRVYRQQPAKESVSCETFAVTDDVPEPVRANGAPADPLLASVFHLNAAMFSTAAAERLARSTAAMSHEADIIEDTRRSLMAARLQIVTMLEGGES